ncbi:MAG: DUF4011 domain-containing protein, partial [Candidatus Omnitrophica bacterium]|nr:DUF4011 domain-containing protein [Candidatus Omnitrophota bacterium]
MPTQLDLKLINCKEKLINLTRQNNLLFYKKRKLSTLVLKVDNIQSFYDALLDEKEFSFWEFPEERPEEQDKLTDEAQLLQEGNQSKTTENIDWLLVKPPEEDEIVCEFSSNDELHKILKNLYRRAKTEYEERGLNIAFIFFGLVEWSEKQNGEFIKTPLVLAPITIEHKSASESYQIMLGDDEVILNPALRVKFKRDFNISFPEFENNPEDWNLEKYFALIERELTPLHMKISQDVHVGLFSFHKLIMYNDYEKNHELLKQHPLISCFGGEGKIDNIDSGGNDYSEESLEESKDIKRQFYVLDADSSQQKCIETARKGESFVMVGPPGTGKSQTIANIIAEFIEDGKSILFVSEKMAALEVVFKRLKGCGLIDFCLVIEELGRSLAEKTIPKETISDTDYTQFLRLRKRLNDYLLALHSRREPLKMSVYEVLSQLASIDYLLYIPTGLRSDIRGLTQEALVEFDGLFDTLETLWDVFIKGDEFPWYGFSSLEYSPSARYRMEELLDKIITKTNEAVSQKNSFQNTLGLPSAVSIKDFQEMIVIIEMLAQNIYVPSSWTEAFDYQHICSVLLKLKEATQKYFLANSYITEKYTEGFFLLNDEYFRNLISAMRELQAKLNIEEYEFINLVKDLPTLKEYLCLLEETLRRIFSNQEIIWQDLDVPAVKSLKNLEYLYQSVILLFDDENRPELVWFDSEKCNQLDLRIKFLEQCTQDIQSIEKDLFLRYKKEILDLDYIRFLHVFKKNGFYRTYILKYLLPRYYKDMKKISSCFLSKTKIVPREFYNDLLKIKNLAELRMNINRDIEADKSIFGRFYAGELTKFVSVRQALTNLNTVKTLLMKIGLSDCGPLIKKLQESELRQRCSAVAEETASQDKKIFEYLLKKGIPIVDFKSLAITDLLSTLSHVIASISSLMLALPPMQNCLKAGKQYPYIQEIEESCKCLHEWRRVKDDFLQQEEQLSLLFGAHYHGVNTDWVVVDTALQWYRNLHSKIPSLPADGRLKKLLVDANLRKIDDGKFCVLKQLIEELSTDYTKLWEEFNTMILNGKNISWDKDELVLVIDKVTQLQKNLDKLKLWIDWQRVNDSFGRAGLEKFLNDIYKSREQIFYEQVRLIFRKAIFSEWLNAVYMDDNSFKGFRGEDHTKARDKFAALDFKLNRLSRSLVIQSANEKKPVMLDGGAGGSQVGILRREAAKQKRHKPIKRLFAETSELVMKLKRCFLMSPMSVCQYLEPEKFKFDLVVFDEASQICVEDAFPPILRAKQVIIAGDNKQLPPTSFFKSEEQYEFDEDEGAPDIENLECILEECQGVGLKEYMLKWHYRSRHEDLINYSNCKFYKHQLVTFPAPLVNVDYLGVKFDFVNNAIYDRGGQRNNLAEARRVAELVFEHFKNYPNKSLGVATLSIAQMEAVWDAVELKLKENPEYAKFFTDNRLDGFFIKNLESVQGDERDVIILSVGYGKDATGRLSMHFGPLNRNGGERRLNVLVTRAREKIIVVTSIRASDFDPNIMAEGVLHLRNYLAFAEKGNDALSTELIGQKEDFESPLEESIAASIRELGYEVLSQVGCAGYRIDLGVIDPANPQR